MTVSKVVTASGSPSVPNAGKESNCLISSTCAQVVLDKRLFSHIHLDAFLSNSALEEGDPEYALKYLKNALMQLQTNLPAEDQVKANELLTILTSFRKEICAHDCSALKVGEKLLVKGGWGTYHHSESGHAMLYLLEKSSAEHFNITIFNTGAGCERHIGSSAISICPVQKYVNVPWNQIQLNDKYDFFEMLAQLLANYWNHEDTSKFECFKESFYQASSRSNDPLTFLYECCFKRWEQYLDKSKTGPLMKGQKSGTCSYRVFLALFKSYLSHDGYKLFKYYLKRDSLLQFYEQCKADNSLHVETNAILLQDAGEKLLRSMAKPYCPDRPSDPLLPPLSA
jgi:hypothetical protein